MAFDARQLDVVIRRTAQAVPLSDEEIVKSIVVALQRSNVTFAPDVRVALSVTFLDDAAMQALNRTYRAKDAPTDVLSFPETFAAQPAPGVDRRNEREVVTEDVTLGDVIISCATVERYAIMDGVPFVQALLFVIAHGVLHLLGYNHSEMMFAIQDTVVKETHEA